MNVEIEIEACKAAEMFLRTSPDFLVRWKTSANDGLRSATGCLHYFSDRSHNSVTAEVLELYLLHDTFKKFMENALRCRIMNGETVAA